MYVVNLSGDNVLRNVSGSGSSAGILAYSV